MNSVLYVSGGREWEVSCTLEFSACKDRERLGSLELESRGCLSCQVWTGCWELNLGHKLPSLQSHYIVGILYLMVV